MQNSELGKYKRPDIFINEIDMSIVELPIQQTLINLVPGFSKKGPINNPTYVETKNDFITIFGDIDRNLERKGSYFHRTCLNMLDSGPIWALNLLSTNDDRDKLQRISLSSAPIFDNDLVMDDMPYSRIFNRQDFWKRDTESFLDYINYPTPDTSRLFHITNLGQKTITVFAYKSKITGFNVTAEDWYGGRAKVPQYINPKDWISDYIISVLAIEGDWSNYNELSIDPNWSVYFDSTGLIKTNIQNFVNETNVNTIFYSDMSLIPNFRDIEGRDMYIKNIINNSTTRTGLFCAYNEELLLEADYPTALADLIGGTIVGEGVSEFEFLSYKENIVETIEHGFVKLDELSNVFGNLSTGTTATADVSSRTALNTNWYVDDLSFVGTGSTLFTIEGTSGDTEIIVSGDTTGMVVGDPIYFTKTLGTIVADKVYYIQTTGATIFTISDYPTGTELVVGADLVATADTYAQTNTFTLSAGASPYFNINGVKYNFASTIGTNTYYLKPLADLTKTRYDILYLTGVDNSTVNILPGEENNIKPIFSGDYDNYIILGYFEISYLSSIDIIYHPITVGYSGYITIDVICNVGVDGKLVIEFEHTSGTNDLTDYNKLRHRAAYDHIETNLRLGKGLIVNLTDWSKEEITKTDITIADYNTSTNGLIYLNITDAVDCYTGTSEFLVYFLDNETYYDYDSSTINSFITTNQVYNSSNNYGVIGKYSDLYMNFYNGIINNGDRFNNGTDDVYLKMFSIGDSIHIEFLDVDGLSFEVVVPTKFDITSHILNYEQTLEIVSYTGTLPHNVYEIKVDKNRYSEVIRGNFIEAYYDETQYEFGGDKYGYQPRKLTRIIQTKIDTVNPNLKVLKTDDPILIESITYSGTTYYQTTVHPQIENYVTTYKGIILKGFTISADSIPNKTEERLKTILNVIYKTTNLAKALANKNKISWRYLVDSFGLGLTEDSKQQLVDVCGLKKNCLGFINAPSVKTLKASANPSFVNDDRTLNIEYLANGGDESKNPSFLYSFAKGDGRSCAAYFFPYVVVSGDNNTDLVPPASYVATTYMKKFISTQSSIEPWTICAGITDGRIFGIRDTEIDFSDEDLEALYGMNLNPIVKKVNNGFCINSESTAQVFPYSSLSLIHSREVLIELENSLYDMLLRYQWKFNTPEVRGEIKYKSDKICKDMQDREALYAYKNIIDESNNTNYIISLQMGVLDTFIEIIKGMGIIINNITILKKGDLESSGF